MRSNASKITRGAVIAALYAALVAALQPVSFGPVQFRAAEALTLLPMLVPEAVPGLFIGCLLSNALGGFGVIDMILGSAATLAAALLTRRSRSLFVGALWPVVVNGVVVGAYLSFLTEMPIYLSIAWVSLGEAGVCFGLGVPMMKALSKVPSLRGEGC